MHRLQENSFQIKTHFRSTRDKNISLGTKPQLMQLSVQISLHVEMFWFNTGMDAECASVQMSL